MNITTNLHGRLRNTSLPTTRSMLPLFEAVANAIHAIEDLEMPSENGNILIQIIRDGHLFQDFPDRLKRPGREPMSGIIGFKIVDNGIGFTDENMLSFMTLDSEHKAARGARGVGRLLWLKAFDSVSIRSVYKSPNNEMLCREFTFSELGVSEPIMGRNNDATRNTTVTLEGFSKRYRDCSYKTAYSIARELVEHNLWYFIRPGGAPKIKIEDEGESIDLDDIYQQQMIEASVAESISLKGTTFELMHVKLVASHGRNHSIAFCASNRVVTQEPIKGIPGLQSWLSDGQNQFVYECYVSSMLLDEKVRAERTSFDISENPLELLDELSKKEIREEVMKRVAAHLSVYLEEGQRLGLQRIVQFVDKRAPRYKPLLARIPQEQLCVDPDISDKDLELHLHKLYAEIENRLLAEGHDVMWPKGNETHNEYKKRVMNYLETVKDMKKSDLANYVSHRRVIIDILAKAIERQDQGNYAPEAWIHSLIMPMGKTSDDVFPDECNLWLVDERLAFHDYLASDKPLSSMPITGSKDGKEPDLVALNVYDTPVLVSDRKKLPLASIVIVELKRPMRNDSSAGEEKHPLEQALGYLERIRAGKVTTKTGRPIPKSEDIPAFCYAICDITPTVEKRCHLLNIKQTSDKAGFFGYNDHYKAYLEVISYDRLINAARERNRVFFDKLGLPTE